MKAIIAGASGFVGTFLSEVLLSADEYEKVYVLVRKPIALSHPKLVQIPVNYDALENVTEYIDKDSVVFCCLGTTMKIAGSKEAFYYVDFTCVAKLAGLAKQQGVSRFLLVSANGANPSAAVYYSRVKGEIERYLVTLNFENLSILRPSLLMGERKEKRIGEKIGQAIAGALSFLFVGALRRYKGIHGKTVANALYKISTQAPSSKVWENEEIEAVGQ